MHVYIFHWAAAVKGVSLCHTCSLSRVDELTLYLDAHTAWVFSDTREHTSGHMCPSLTKKMWTACMRWRGRRKNTAQAVKHSVRHFVFTHRTRWNLLLFLFCLLWWSRRGCSRQSWRDVSFIELLVSLVIPSTDGREGENCSLLFTWGVQCQQHMTGVHCTCFTCVVRGTSTL